MTEAEHRSAPSVLVVRIGGPNAAPSCLPPGDGFLCHEVFWPQGAGRYGHISGQPDLIILDFPQAESMDFSLCPDIKSRAGGTPVIVIGADTQTDRIVCLELGADDYLSRPFNPRELAARARAILRARGRPAYMTARSSTVSTKWRLDHEQRCLIAMTGVSKKLNPVEYWLLKRFMEQPDTVHTREALAAYLRDKQSIPYTPLSIIVFVNALREKLEDHGPFTLIRTLRGKGYVYARRW